MNVVTFTAREDIPQNRFVAVGSWNPEDPRKIGSPAIRLASCIVGANYRPRMFFRGAYDPLRIGHSTSISAGVTSPCLVYTDGIIQGFDSLVPGLDYYLDPDKPGEMTTYQELYIRNRLRNIYLCWLGYAVTESSLYFLPGPPQKQADED